ncbi:MAG: hemerythrin family protein [Ignavibacteriales bacterium]|nr:hemerythrin family protein [Ignavibacteriales bacterium]
MELIPWRKEFEIGINAIDEQHKVLVGFINKLAEAKNVNDQSLLFKETLFGLVEYTKVHFATEEGIMAQMRYPKLAEHKAQHQILIKQVINIIQNVAENHNFINDDLMLFLRNWLVHHVLGHDKLVGEYSRKIHWDKQHGQ